MPYVIILGNLFDSHADSLLDCQLVSPLVHLVHLWTHGESNPELIHAMDACYRYTMSPRGR